ncbi:hypothetical protein DFJ74DRAFT_689805 [Hyaloraphidium curvatum]|nr:hypothetical protein DFJ74DRAFT_689805 [Hyaloraphidium curvatum]
MAAGAPRTIASFFSAKPSPATRKEVVVIDDSDDVVDSAADAGEPVPRDDAGAPEPSHATPARAPPQDAPSAADGLEGTSGSVERKRKSPDAAADDDPMILDQPASPPPRPVPSAKKAKTASGAASPSTPDSRAAEVKDGKIVFKESKMEYGQAPYSLKETFTFMEFRKTQTEPATTFPEQWLPLVGKLVQDKTTSREVLAKEVLKKLCPNEEEDSQDPPAPPYLSASVVAEAISSVAERKNYGVQRNGAGPQQLSIWRWEVRDLEATFPADVVQKIRTRRERRVKAQEELQGWLDALPEEKQTETLNPEKKKRAKKSDVLPGSAVASPAPANAAGAAEKENQPAPAAPAPAQAASETPATGKKKKEPKAPVDKQKTAEKGKVAEKGKKAAEPKPDQHNLTTFFKVVEREKPAQGSGAAALCEFDRMFLPFVGGKEVQIAPHIPFPRVLQDSFESLLESQDATVSIAEWVAQAKATNVERVVKRHAPYKALYAEKDGVVMLDDAPLKLAERKPLRKKLLQFRSEYDLRLRPPYWGVFTKASNVVTGRRPFARESTLDYEYDSEEEWEEEEEGEDLGSDDEDEDDRASRSSLEPDEDDDGWLEKDDGQADGGSGLGTPRPSSPTGPKKARIQQISEPVVIGPIFDDVSLGEFAPNARFAEFACEVLVETTWCINPFDVQFNDALLGGDGGAGGASEGPGGSKSAGAKSGRGKKKQVFPPDKLQELAGYVQGSTKSLPNLVEEVKLKFPDVPKKTLSDKIKEIADTRKGSKPLWQIKPNVVQEMASADGPRALPGFG